MTATTKGRKNPQNQQEEQDNAVYYGRATILHPRAISPTATDIPGTPSGPGVVEFLDAAGDMGIINDRLSRSKLDEGDVYTFYTVMSTSAVDSYYTFMDEQSLQNCARDFGTGAGLGLMLNHERQAMPIGRSYKAIVCDMLDDSGQPMLNILNEPLRALMVAYYIRRGKSASDDLIADIDAGIVNNTSISFRYTVGLCSICGENQMQWPTECPHFAGLADDEGVMCYQRIMDATAFEGSAVWYHATPGSFIQRALDMVTHGRLGRSQVRKLEAAYGVRMLDQLPTSTERTEPIMPIEDKAITAPIADAQASTDTPPVTSDTTVSVPTPELADERAFVRSFLQKMTDHAGAAISAANKDILNSVAAALESVDDASDTAAAAIAKLLGNAPAAEDDEEDGEMKQTSFAGKLARAVGISASDRKAALNEATTVAISLRSLTAERDNALVELASVRSSLGAPEGTPLADHLKVVSREAATGRAYRDEMIAFISRAFLTNKDNSQADLDEMLPDYRQMSLNQLRIVGRTLKAEAVNLLGIDTNAYDAPGGKVVGQRQVAPRAEGVLPTAPASSESVAAYSDSGAVARK